jgi:MaoC dehydratase-like protein
MNPDAQGTVYPPVPFVVEPQRVAAFRRVFGQASGVPPTFLTAAEFTAFPAVLGDPNLALDFSRVLHGSQEYEYQRPLREGETLSVVARIGSIRRKGENAFLTIVMDVFGDDGALAATATSVMIERAPDG